MAASRLQRAFTLTVHYLKPDGSWAPHEIQGKEEWAACWRVYKNGMRGLKGARPKTMDRYSRKIVDLIEAYGEKFHWIVAQGDMRMRWEHFPRLMRRAEM